MIERVQIHTPGLIRLISTGYRRHGPLHAGPISRQGGVARRAPGQGLLLVLTMTRTNESLESPQTLANYMVIRCATVGFNALTLCRGCTWVGYLLLWVGEGSLCARWCVRLSTPFLFFVSRLCDFLHILSSGSLFLGWHAAWYQTSALGRCSCWTLCGLGCTEPLRRVSSARTRFRLPQTNMEGTVWDAGVAHV